MVIVVPVDLVDRLGTAGPVLGALLVDSVVPGEVPGVIFECGKVVDLVFPGDMTPGTIVVGGKNDESASAAGLRLDVA